MPVVTDDPLPFNGKKCIAITPVCFRIEKCQIIEGILVLQFIFTTVFLYDIKDIVESILVNPFLV